MLNWQGPLIAGAIVLVALLGLLSVVWRTGGEHVALQAQHQADQVAVRTANAVTVQVRHAGSRVAAHDDHVRAIQSETANARRSIADAPDLDARIAAASAFAQRMSDDATSARSAALRDYDTSIVPFAS